MAGIELRSIQQYVAKLHSEKAQNELDGQSAKGKELDGQSAKENEPDGQSAKVVQETKPKKPKKDGPKTGGGAYGIFVEKNRAKFQKLCQTEGLKGKAVFMLAGKAWREMDAAARRPYQEMFEKKKGAVEQAKLNKALAIARRSCRRGKQHDEEDDDNQAALSAEERRIRPNNILPFHKVGTQVLLHGLVSAPEKNGQLAYVLKYDAEARRYVVKLSSSSEQTRVRPWNVSPCLKAGTKALLAKNAAASDDTSSTSCLQPVRIQAFDPATRLYMVLVNGSSESVQPERVSPLFSASDRLLLQGLSGAAELNDHQGKVEQFNEVAGRYVVNVACIGEAKNLRPENLQLQLADNSNVVLHGLQQNEELNGAQVKLVRFDDTTGRYIVRVPQATSKSQNEVEQAAPAAETAEGPQVPQPRRVWMTTKTPVVIWGRLKRLPELVGQVGFVDDIDKELSMYIVRLPEIARLEIVETNHLCAWFAPGTEVLIQSAPKLDGQVARIEKFIAYNGTYVVRLDKNSELKVVKPENLCRWFAPRAKVMLVGLPRSPQLDGKLARIAGFDNTDGRYLVELAKPPKKTLLKPEHLRFPTARRTLVKLEGLKDNPELNGQLATVERYDAAKGEYAVFLCKQETHHNMRPENLWEATAAEVEAYANREDDPAEGAEPDNFSVDSGDVLDRLPQPGSPAVSSSSGSSDSLGRKRKKKRGGVADMDSMSKVPRSLLRDAVAKTMKACHKKAAGAQQRISMEPLSLDHSCTGE